MIHARMNMLDASINKRDLIVQRAHLLRKARAFFEQRGIFEVDPLALSRGAPVDLHIDPITVRCMGKTAFLHTSPEYAMKRLLSEGVGDIYFLGHVFRDEESSFVHQPEFTMAEWYRIGFSFKEMIDETVQFIRYFLGNITVTQMTYREAFHTYAGIDIAHASDGDLLALIQKKGIIAYPSIVHEGRDALLNLILALVVQPALEKIECVVLTHFPASQAALAKIALEGEFAIAERFEVFYKGVELANGYHESGSSLELHERFIETNLERQKMGKQPLPIDNYFLVALEKGIPDCCGVAVGVDRVFMLQQGMRDIAKIIPLHWNEV